MDYYVSCGNPLGIPLHRGVVQAITYRFAGSIGKSNFAAAAGAETLAGAHFPRHLLNRQTDIAVSGNQRYRYSLSPERTNENSGSNGNDDHKKRHAYQ